MTATGPAAARPESPAGRAARVRALDPVLDRAPILAAAGAGKEKDEDARPAAADPGPARRPAPHPALAPRVPDPSHVPRAPAPNRHPSRDLRAPAPSRHLSRGPSRLRQRSEASPAPNLVTADPHVVRHHRRTRRWWKVPLCPPGRTLQRRVSMTQSRKWLRRRMRGWLRRMLLLLKNDVVRCEISRKRRFEVNQHVFLCFGVEVCNNISRPGPPETRMAIH
mmetsp:Transcript_50440/g.96360  ORF Transcript_50440/g.96360 Transcript_50440/m.96360 type:complete len:222 (+) Transcript_50440:295-960(+)